MTKWRSRAALCAAGLCLLLVVGVNLPLFLRMPLWCDVHYYDLITRKWLGGQALYRDIFDNNLPGIVWLQAGVRSLVGWTPEAILAVDFAIFAVTAWLLSGWWRGAGRSWAMVVATAAALLAFFFVTPESCHFQRDPITLCLAAAALWLRRRQIRRIGNPNRSARRLLLWGAAEGVLWGMAVWLKPFVSIPALACWAVSLRLGPVALGRRRVADAAGLLLGGLVVGGLGIAELYRAGSWPAFRDIIFVWNQEYSRPVSWSLRLQLFFLERFTPWGLLHVPALFLAIGILIHTFLKRRSEPPPPSYVLLAACYLAWVVQSLGIQRQWHYVNLPPVALAISLLAGWVTGLRRKVFVRVAVPAFLVFAAVWHPMFRPARLGYWPKCWSAPSASRELRSALALEGEEGPVWEDLDRVEDYLRKQGVADGDVLCHHPLTCSLYIDLGLMPRTRYMYPEYYLKTFPQHRPMIARELAANQPIYVVNDLTWLLLVDPNIADEVPEGECAVPGFVRSAQSRRRPWSDPIVFRAGRYLVHRLTPEEKGW